MNPRISSCRGFTLIELLVVIGIVALLAGMIAYLPSSEKRHGNVRSAAEELAATLRAARSLAMQQQAVCGVAFNIRNGVGTSGRILNNRDGGHWYRIIGPSELQNGFYPKPSFTHNGGGKYTRELSTVAGHLSEIQASWVGDRHILPPKKVRFLALTDQDNGTKVDPTTSAASSMRPFPPTYPRPWFGWWDSSTRRLHAWGGYDSSIVDSAGWSCSGFYYQGTDGPITGSRNPSDRFTTWEGAGNGKRILSADQGRPLVHGDWLDYVILFYPDGRTDQGSTFAARYESLARKGAAGGAMTGGLAPYGDLGDLVGGTTAPNAAWGHLMSSYVEHTGVYAVTLCPDVDKDTDVFPSAEAAFRSMWPMYRVTVNRYGYVRVDMVSQREPPGVIYDTTISDWQNKTQIRQAYRHLAATDAQGNPRGMPVSDFLTPRILENRQWWLVTP